MTRSDELLCITDLIFDRRQYVTLLGIRHPAIRRQMDELENRMLLVEELISHVADDGLTDFGLMNEVRGMLVPAVRS